MSLIRCDECGIGHCRDIQSPFLLNLGHHMMVIPDAPAYCCDICGNRFFDDGFLNRVHFLLEQAASDSRQRTRRRQLPRPEPATQPHARRSR